MLWAAVGMRPGVSAPKQRESGCRDRGLSKHAALVLPAMVMVTYFKTLVSVTSTGSPDP